MLTHINIKRMISLKMLSRGLNMLTLLCAITATDAFAAATKSAPDWLEADSAAAIHARLLRDFPYTYAEGCALLKDAYPGLTDADIRAAVDKHYIETMTIDGTERMFRKAVRNFGLLNPAYNGGWKHRGWNASAERISYVDSVLSFTAGTLPDGAAHRVLMRFSIDVPYADCLANDTVRVWMPYPIASARQYDIRLVSTSQPDYVISCPCRSAHRTIYMQAPVTKGKPTRFDYEVEFTTAGQYFSPEYIMKNIRPYDKTSPDYRRYTSFDGPHYIDLSDLAREIVGDETDPYRQSELVYDYIIQHYPWAGAREYSTIPCIPQYVRDEGHGDCGQVALLYISLMRSLGVPARWESGWMLHPGDKNFHDWAEVFFEGVGWVPVDVSFGRYTSSDDPAVQRFYSTGMDAHRFVSNTGVGDVLYPAKRYLRSETVDFQAGEVETSKGNLFYPAWDSSLEILSVTPVSDAPVLAPDAAALIDQVRQQYVPDRRQNVFEIEAVPMADGKTMITGKTSSAPAYSRLASLVAASGLNAENHVALLPDTVWAQVKIPVACMRSKGAYSSELATQAIMGMPMRVLETDGGWWRVQSPDGYVGWVWRGSLAPKTMEELAEWRHAPRLVVTSHYEVRAYTDARTSSPRSVVTELVPGSIVEGTLKHKTNGRVEVTLPDGRKGWVDAKALSSIEDWAAQDFDPDVILDQAYALEGAPYLWGGTSTKNTDCSGMVKVSYLANGLMLRRDASQQALTGGKLKPEDWREYQTGDLLFFGEKPGGRVTHVGIYDHDGKFIHCAGRIHRSSLDPDDPDYAPRIFFGGSRIHGYEGTDGITFVRDHPWYF